MTWKGRGSAIRSAVVTDLLVTVTSPFAPWKFTPGRLWEALQTHPDHRFSCFSGFALEPGSELMV